MIHIYILSKTMAMEWPEYQLDHLNVLAVTTEEIPSTNSRKVEKVQRLKELVPKAKPRQFLIMILHRIQIPKEYLGRITYFLELRKTLIIMVAWEKNLFHQQELITWRHGSPRSELSISKVNSPVSLNKSLIPLTCNNFNYCRIMNRRRT